MSTQSMLLDTARHYRETGRAREAEATYRRVIDEEPAFRAFAWHELGLMALEAGRNGEAVERISKAIELNGTVAGFFADLSLALEATGQLDGALAHAEGAIALGGASIPLLSRLFFLYLRLDRPSDAVALATLLSDDPSLTPVIAADPLMRGFRADMRRTIGDHAGAKTDIRGTLAGMPDSASGWYLLGRIARAAGDDARALACYDRAATTGRFANLTFDKGISLQKLGQIEQARSCFRQVTNEYLYAMCRGADIELPALAGLDISPERSEAVRQRGHEAERLGQRLEALAHFALASSLTPKDGRARADLDRLLATMGKRRASFHFLLHSSMLLALEGDGYLRRVQLGQVPDDLQIVFLSGTRPTNRTILRLLERHIPLVIDDRLLYSMAEVLLAGLSLPRNFLLDNTYDNYANPQSRAQLTFTPEEMERGRAGLRRLGIDPDKDWFACVFARDDGWVTKSFSGLTDMYCDFRNADINTYRPAIQHIVDRGGTVVRIGALARTPLDMSHPKVIDYAMTARDDFMDIFLVAHARFVMGTPAGILDAARTFDTPCLFVNSVPVGFCPYGKRVLYLSKRLVRAATGEPVPIGEYLAHFRTPDPTSTVFTDSGLARHGYAYVDNTPEELREAAEEMLDLLEGRWGQDPADRVLLDRYFAVCASVPHPTIAAPARVRLPPVLAHLKRYRSWYFPNG
jgi:putative glycosyltransferase (TIGR04372 family)